MTSKNVKQKTLMKKLEKYHQEDLQEALLNMLDQINFDRKALISMILKSGKTRQIIEALERVKGDSLVVNNDVEDMLEDEIQLKNFKSKIDIDQYDPNILVDAETSDSDLTEMFNKKFQISTKKPKLKQKLEESPKKRSHKNGGLDELTSEDGDDWNGKKFENIDKCCLEDLSSEEDVINIRSLQNMPIK
ncbi:hypothetical protein MHBO_002063 [Bonamia ostreae]|uniref:Uncharacterized protein n=1 Tax=Bonamia ostreae TaxID=126728 RepID=A0ABV2AL36_9EUKA